MIHNDGGIEFSGYTDASLEASAISVDRLRYPVNHAAICKEIERRKTTVVWNETASKFRALVRHIQVSRFLMMSGFFVVCILFAFGFQVVIGREIDFISALVLFVSFAAISFYVNLRLSRNECPNCRRALGVRAMSDDVDFQWTKKCPHCDYSA